MSPSLFTSFAGTLHQWISLFVVPFSGGSQTDFGLNVGGRVKLVRSSTLEVGLPFSALDPLASGERRRRQSESEDLVGAGLDAFDMVCKPDQPSSLVVASDAGMVLHASRFGAADAPSYYFARTIAPSALLPRSFSLFQY